MSTMIPVNKTTNCKLPRNHRPLPKRHLDTEDIISEPVLPAYSNRPYPIRKPNAFPSKAPICTRRPCITRPRHPYPSSPSSKGAPQTHPLPLPNSQVLHGPPQQVPPARPTPPSVPPPHPPRHQHPSLTGHLFPYSRTYLPYLLHQPKPIFTWPSGFAPPSSDHFQQQQQ